MGSYLVRSLVSHGGRVRVLLRPGSPRAQLLEGLAVERVAGDLIEPESLRAVLKGVTQVYHLAGETGYTPASSEHFYRINVEGTSNLLQACGEVGIQRMVHVSSAVTLGPTTPDRPLAEENPTPPGPATPYVASKRRGETLALEAASEGLPVVVVNPSLVLGPQSGRRPPRDLVARAAQGRPLWVLPGGSNIVDVADVVFCLEAAMERGEVGKRYIVGAVNLSWMGLYRKLDALLGARRRRWLVPEGLLRSAAWAGCRWPRLFPSPHSLHWEDILQGRMAWYFDASRARKTFHWTPRPLDLTLRTALSGCSAANFPAKGR